MVDDVYGIVTVPMLDEGRADDEGFVIVKEPIRACGKPSAPLEGIAEIGQRRLKIVVAKKNRQGVGAGEATEGVKHASRTLINGFERSDSLVGIGSERSPGLALRVLLGKEVYEIAIDDKLGIRFAVDPPEEGFECLGAGHEDPEVFVV